MDGRTPAPRDTEGEPRIVAPSIRMMNDRLRLALPDGYIERRQNETLGAWTTLAFGERATLRYQYSPFLLRMIERQRLSNEIEVGVALRSAKRETHATKQAAIIGGRAFDPLLAVADHVVFGRVRRHAARGACRESRGGHARHRRRSRTAAHPRRRRDRTPSEDADGRTCRTNLAECGETRRNV